MKTFKTILTAVLFLTVSNGLMAQGNSSNANINANARVIQAISVTGEEALEFGTVVANTSKTVALNGGVTAGGVTNVQGVTPEQAGRFLVSAAPTSSVNLSFTNIPSVLSFGAETMEVTYTAGWGLLADAVTTNAVDVAVDVTTNISSFPENDLTGTNGIYVFLGGTVTAATTQAPGVYTAAITLTAEYN